MRSIIGGLKKMSKFRYFGMLQLPYLIFCSLLCVIRKTGEINLIPPELVPKPVDSKTTELVRDRFSKTAMKANFSWLYPCLGCTLASLVPLFSDLQSQTRKFQDFFPLRYSLVIPTAKVFAGALYDFGSATFADFRELSLMERVGYTLEYCFQYRQEFSYSDPEESHNI